MRMTILALLAVLVPSAAPATGPYLTVGYLDVEPNGIVAQTGAFLVMMPCTGLTGECDVNRFVTVQVSPCPPGVPCDGGVHEFTWDAQHESSTPILLSPETTYDFTGSFEVVSWGLDQANKCRVELCRGSGPLTGTSVTTPALVRSKWNAEVVGFENGLAQVEFTPTANELFLCGVACYQGFYDLVLTPCPPGVQCQNGESSWETVDTDIGGEPPTPIVVGLDPSVPYQAGGGLSAVFLLDSQGGYFCDDYRCGYYDEFDPVEVLASVPTDPTSWGVVKGRY